MLVGGNSRIGVHLETCRGRRLLRGRKEKEDKGMILGAQNSGSQRIRQGLGLHLLVRVVDDVSIDCRSPVSWNYPSLRCSILMAGRKLNCQLLASSGGFA